LLVDRPRQVDTASARAIEALAVRGSLVSYVVAIGALVAFGGLVALSSEPRLAVVGPVIGAGLAVVAASLTIIVAVQVRRLRRHVDELDGELSQLRQAYDRARLDALLDGLTGLGNHRAFQEELDSRIAAARAEGASLALLMLDVDDLKKMNDDHGHAAGDQALRTVAQILRANLRPTDRAYRIGGDEFAVLLPGGDVDSAEMTANHILAAALSGNHGAGGVLSLTIGVTAFPELSSGRRQMIIQADAALYSGKRHGRTTVERFDPGRHGIAHDTRTLDELAAAIEQVVVGDLLRPVYQPIFSLETGQVIGFEGLVRLSAEVEFADPSSLFIAAEATRRTVELDVVSATTVLAGARGMRPGDYLAINLSPRTLESDAFSPLEVVALARRYGVPPSQLVVELTEREAVEDLGRLQAAVAALRRHGVRIAIDDVGAGNAGLRLMSSVEFDIMKIDLSLVRAGAHHEPSEAVLRALGGLARERGRKIVAEGIESADLLEAVLELRYDAGQGYLLGRPSGEIRTEPAQLFDLIASPLDEATSAA
jgi:diguanylate cyclase (GGDEF)-like protein